MSAAELEEGTSPTPHKSAKRRKRSRRRMGSTKGRHRAGGRRSQAASPAVTPLSSRRSSRHNLDAPSPTPAGKDNPRSRRQSRHGSPATVRTSRSRRTSSWVSSLPPSTTNSPVRTPGVSPATSPVRGVDKGKDSPSASLSRTQPASPTVVTHAERRSPAASPFTPPRQPPSLGSAPRPTVSVSPVARRLQRAEFGKMRRSGSRGPRGGSRGPSKEELMTWECQRDYCVTKDTYYAFYQRMYESLIPRPTTGTPRRRNVKRIIKQDWQNDSQGAPYLNFDQFCNSLFELTGVCIETPALCWTSPASCVGRVAITTALSRCPGIHLGCSFSFMLIGWCPCICSLFSLPSLCWQIRGWTPFQPRSMYVHPPFSYLRLRLRT